MSAHFQTEQKTYLTFPQFFRPSQSCPKGASAFSPGLALRAVSQRLPWERGRLEYNYPNGVVKKSILETFRHKNCIGRHW